MKNYFNLSWFDAEFSLSMADVREYFLEVLSISCGLEANLDGLTTSVSNFWKPNL